MAARSEWTLGLMRHAKSDWSEEGLSDHDRPLNARGRRDAPEMARWLESQDMVPDLILASTATRVQETIQRLLQVWTVAPQIFNSSALYHATPQTILEHIRCDAVMKNATRPHRLLVVGHNPGMELLVSSLTSRLTPMPTAAIALFRCAAIEPTDEDAPNVLKTLAIGRPKELD